MSLYEFALLGSVSHADRAAISDSIQAVTSSFELGFGTDVVLFDGNTVATRNPHVSFAAVYFGGKDRRDDVAVSKLAGTSAPVIPFVELGTSFADSVPAVLHGSNALFRRPDDNHLTELTSALMECAGLLRRQRRVFISYRRIESRTVATQLYDLLAARGFDVFLDTHDIRPGEPFQEVLWHRLCDSDVLVMLDTPKYFESKWTAQELGRAAAKEIHVLRLVWPGHSATRFTSLSDSIFLNAADLEGPDGPLELSIAETIVVALERVRSRSIAARSLSMIGRLRSELGRIGATLDGIGAHRAVRALLADGRRVWLYPVVGVPTADLFNDITNKAAKAQPGEMPFLIYDHVGIRDQWAAHLRWLDEQVHCVRAVKLSEAAWTFAGI